MFLINGFPALPFGAMATIPNERLQSLPNVGDVITPFLQDYSYVVDDIKRHPQTHHDYNIHYFYEIYLAPENESAKIAFERQFGKKRASK